MSVPAYKRQKPDPNNPRDPEFVLLSKKLYVEVIDLLSCMGARYGRLIAVPTAELAGEVQDFAVKANDVFPSDGLAQIPAPAFTRFFMTLPSTRRRTALL